MNKPFKLFYTASQEFDTWEEMMQHPGAKEDGSTVLFNCLGVHMEISRENGTWGIDVAMLPKEANP